MNLEFFMKSLEAAAETLAASPEREDRIVAACLFATAASWEAGTLEDLSDAMKTFAKSQLVRIARLKNASNN